MKAKQTQTSETGSNSEPMERWRLPLLETPLEDCTESLLKHFPASRPVFPRAWPWKKLSLFKVIFLLPGRAHCQVYLSLPGSKTTSCGWMCPCPRLFEGPRWSPPCGTSECQRADQPCLKKNNNNKKKSALPWPLLFLPSSPIASTSAGSEITVI